MAGPGDDDEYDGPWIGLNHIPKRAKKTAKKSKKRAAKEPSARGGAVANRVKVDRPYYFAVVEKKATAKKKAAVVKKAAVKKAPAKAVKRPAKTAKKAAAKGRMI